MAAQLGFHALALLFERLNLLAVLGRGKLLRTVEDECGKFRIRGGQFFQQVATGSIGALAERRQTVGQRVKDAALASQQGDKRELTRRGVCGCVLNVEGKRLLQVSGKGPKVRELLALGAGGEIERQVLFVNRGGALEQG